VTEPMLLDRPLPEFDATRVEHRVIDGDLATVYEATRQADFMHAWRESLAVRALFAVRGAGERAAALAHHRAPVTPPEPESMRLADMPTHADWVLLGEAPPHEIAFGSIGRFWAGETDWEQIRGFLRYWRPLSRFIGVVMRSQLRVVADRAAAALGG
jgi:hypothetical protein